MSPLGFGKKDADLPPEEGDTEYLKALEQKGLVTDAELAELKGTNDETLKGTEIGNYLAETGKWTEVLQAEEVQEALKAVLRALANAGISLADVVPIAGEIPSIGADVGKTVNRLLRVFGVRHNFSDLTPDVPWLAAHGTEGLEIFTGTAAPTHLVETLWQFKADIPRIKEGIRTAKEIRSKGYDSYLANKAEIDDAIDAFSD